MTSYDKTFSTICRVCLEHDKAENMVSLTCSSNENELSSWGVLFEKYTNLSVKQNVYSPTNICEKCKESLLEISKFVSKSEMSDRRLTKLVSFSLKQDLSGELVKEVICQYTLFCQYFPEEINQSESRDSPCDFDDLIEYPDDNPLKFEDTLPRVKKEFETKRKMKTHNYKDPPNDQKDSSQNDCDNVDLFLDSIEKLVTTNVQHVNHRRRVKRDIRSKGSVRNLTCKICLKKLANPATFDYHMQRHGVCRYICDQCGKGFPVLAEMTQHQIYRHGIGPCLECDHCSFKAGKRLELIEHIRLHTGERPFTCETCGLNFRRKAIYKNHLKCHTERSVPCDHCPRKFYRRSEMLAHCNNVHDRMYLYLCKICNMTYAKAQTVRKHMAIKHGVPREMQGKIMRINKSNSTSLPLFKEGKSTELEFPIV